MLSDVLLSFNDLCIITFDNLNYIIIIIILAIYKAPASTASDAHDASLHNNQNNKIIYYTQKYEKKKTRKRL